MSVKKNNKEELIRRMETAKEEKNWGAVDELEQRTTSRTQQEPRSKNRQGKLRHGSSNYLSFGRRKHSERNT